MGYGLIDTSILSDIADAIRSKLGVQTQYKPGQMADAIDGIETGGITPTGTKNITTNGVHDVSAYANANVEVPTGGDAPVLGTKTVTENGTYTASDDSLDGYSAVTVAVPSSADDWEYKWEYESGSTRKPMFMSGTATDATDSLLINKPVLSLPSVEGELEVVAKYAVTASSAPQFGVGTSDRIGFKVFFQDSTGNVRSNISGSYDNYTSDNGFHKIRLKWQNGTGSLYIDDVLAASGAGATASNISGIGSSASTMPDSSAYFKSVKFRRL